MNIEFHYYMTYYLARKGGFGENDSYAIAYSSQYTDDNCVVFEVNKGKSDEFHNYISQTMRITKPKRKLIRIYPCFHFIPGEFASEPAERKDGKMHMLNTTPDSPFANQIIDKALSAEDPYRIGIATHAYADTWTHQNFVGYFDSFNAMAGLLEHVTPNIGHADAQHAPDVPGLVWKDERLRSRNHTISNTTRILDAAKQIFRKFRLHKDSTLSDHAIETEWKPLKKELRDAIGRDFRGRKDRERKNRMARYASLLGTFQEYDEDAWFNEAVEVDIVGLPDRADSDLLSALRLFPDKYSWKPDFEGSHWFRFQQAVKTHQKLAEEMYDDLFQQMEIREVEEY